MNIIKADIKNVEENAVRPYHVDLTSLQPIVDQAVASVVGADSLIWGEFIIHYLSYPSITYPKAQFSTHNSSLVFLERNGNTISVKTYSTIGGIVETKATFQVTSPSDDGGITIGTFDGIETVIAYVDDTVKVSRDFYTWNDIRVYHNNVLQSNIKINPHETEITFIRGETPCFLAFRYTNNRYLALYRSTNGLDWHRIQTFQNPDYDPITIFQNPFDPEKVYINERLSLDYGETFQPITGDPPTIFRPYTIYVPATQSLYYINTEYIELYSQTIEDWYLLHTEEDTIADIILVPSLSLFIGTFEVSPNIYEVRYSTDNITWTKIDIELLENTVLKNLRLSLNDNEKSVYLIAEEGIGSILLTPIFFSVTYNDNEATSGDVPIDSNRYEEGDNVTILGKNTLEKANHTFQGWAFSSSGYGHIFQEGNTIPALGAGNITLYAIWELNKYEVTIHKDEIDYYWPHRAKLELLYEYDDYTNSIMLSHGSALPEELIPETPGYKFDGFYTDEDLQYEWDIDTDEVTEDITLYPKFVGYEVGDPGPAGGIIFYDKGNTTGGWRYLETEVIHIGLSKWSNVEEYISTGQSPGTGYGNTLAIITQNEHQESAALLCFNYSRRYKGVTYNDWFLGSREDMEALFTELQDSIEFLGGYYWTSSGDMEENAWTTNTGSKHSYSESKSEFRYVIPIRRV